MARQVDIANIKTASSKAAKILNDINNNTETIKNTLTSKGFNKIGSSSFNKSNTLIDLHSGIDIGVKSPINKIGYDNGKDVYHSFPLTQSLLKLTTSFNNPEDPSIRVESNNDSRTIQTDRADNDITSVKRWATRCIFKFREEDYGYDRQVYEIPLQYLMEGLVGTSNRHNTTYKEYPYPEEIIMISPTGDREFIHFVNVQYIDGHVNHYGGEPYNLMIAIDRINWGQLNDDGTEFKKYLSVYANNINDSLAFIQNGYLYLPMPDKSFGDDLLNTLWDCKVIWRNDAPDRTLTISYDAEINAKDGRWTETTNGLSSRSWYSICYGNDKYVAVANDSNTFAYSTDGINWTETSNGLSRRNWQSICYGNDKFVAVANDSNTFAYSEDGINWTETSNGLGSRPWSFVGYGNGKFIAVSGNTYTPSNYFAYSTDGINWTETSNGLSGTSWSSVCYGKDKFVAVNRNSSIFARSTDGISWTEFNNGLTNKDWVSICYGNTRYVVISFNSNTFAYSTDGINWTETTNGLSSKDWLSICYGNGKYGVISYNTSRTFAYSIDGINWTETTNGLNQSNWRGICYGKDKFITVAWSSKVFAYSDMDIVDLSIFTLNECNGRLVFAETLRGNYPYINKYRNSIDSNLDGSIFNYNIDTVMNKQALLGMSGIHSSPQFSTYYNPLSGNEGGLLWYRSSPQILIPITHKYYIGIHTTVATNYSNKAKYNLFTKSLYPIKQDGDTDGPCNIDLLTDNIINYYITSSTITDDENGVLIIKFFADTAMYDVTFTLTAGNISHSIETSSYPSNLDITTNKIYSIFQINSNEYLAAIGSKMYSITINEEVTFTEAPYSINSYSNYLIGRYSLAVINSNTITALGEKYSNLLESIGEGSIAENAINKINLGSNEKYHNITGRFALMQDSNDKYYLTHLKEKYTLSGNFMTPPEGKYIWAETTNGLSNRDWRFICYGNNKYIAMGFNSNYFAYSTDGINWTETTNGLVSRQWNSVCYGNSKYVSVAYGSNTFAYSTDGINWKETTNGLSSRSWNSICYGNDMFVAIVFNSRTFAYSTDGINWTETTNGLSSRSWSSICYGNGKYVAEAAGSDYFAYSTDGINWTETSNGLTSRNWRSVCYGNGKYVVVSSSNSNTFAYSTDGINWTETTNGLSRKYWSFICYGNGKFVAVASDSNNYAYSTDGINWTVTTNGLTSRSWQSICYGNGKYVAVAANSNIFAYSDLIPKY